MGAAVVAVVLLGVGSLLIGMAATPVGRNLGKGYDYVACRLLSSGGCTPPNGQDPDGLPVDIELDATQVGVESSSTSSTSSIEPADVSAYTTLSADLGLPPAGGQAAGVSSKCGESAGDYCTEKNIQVTPASIPLTTDPSRLDDGVVTRTVGVYENHNYSSLTRNLNNYMVAPLKENGAKPGAEGKLLNVFYLLDLNSKSAYPTVTWYLCSPKTGGHPDFTYVHPGGCSGDPATALGRAYRDPVPGSQRMVLCNHGGYVPAFVTGDKCAPGDVPLPTGLGGNLLGYVPTLENPGCNGGITDPGTDHAVCTVRTFAAFRSEPGAALRAARQEAADYQANPAHKQTCTETGTHEYNDGTAATADYRCTYVSTTHPNKDTSKNTPAQNTPAQNTPAQNTPTPQPTPVQATVQAQGPTAPVPPVDYQGHLPAVTAPPASAPQVSTLAPGQLTPGTTVRIPASNNYELDLSQQSDGSYSWRTRRPGTPLRLAPSGKVANVVAFVDGKVVDQKLDLSGNGTQGYLQVEPGQDVTIAVYSLQRDFYEQASPQAQLVAAAAYTGTGSSTVPGVAGLLGVSPAEVKRMLTRPGVTLASLHDVGMRLRAARSQGAAEVSLTEDALVQLAQSGARTGTLVASAGGSSGGSGPLAPGGAGQPLVPPGARQLTGSITTIDDAINLSRSTLGNAPPSTVDLCTTAGHGTQLGPEGAVMKLSATPQGDLNWSVELPDVEVWERLLPSNPEYVVTIEADGHQVARSYDAFLNGPSGTVPASSIPPGARITARAIAIQRDPQLNPSHFNVGSAIPHFWLATGGECVMPGAYGQGGSNLDRVERLRRSGLLQEEKLSPGEAPLTKLLARLANPRDTGAPAELGAIERYVAAGKLVLVLSDSSGRTITDRKGNTVNARNPDFDIRDPAKPNDPGQLVDIKARVDALSKNWVYAQVRSVNEQVRDSGLPNNTKGGADLVLTGAAANASLATVANNVRGVFTANDVLELDRVSVYKEGRLVLEWERQPDGTVKQTV